MSAAPIAAARRRPACGLARASLFCEMCVTLSGWVAPFATALGLACYLNCLACDFVFDDRLAILDNRDVQHGAPLSSLWTHDFWGKSLWKHDSHKSYRPLTILSFRFHTWWRQGPPRAADYHAANALLHAIVCGAVAELAARAWNGERGGGQRVALLTSILFAAHPVHVEAVTGTVGRAELLCALACLVGRPAGLTCCMLRRSDLPSTNRPLPSTNGP